ncbi:SDR family NAD(P)-dependent oxidoreductase [Planococcus sp. CAU13]|uniref:SDR family NAD(P)-dependent oxidoreductase n=1 Tax=Planococcus sp. CAU13 TaxID=1541197 RepID=UPI00052FE374|nr:SDR family NAD(P)-dependent oxidoreductase [Planococcus sp. CAU13]
MPDEMKRSGLTVVVTGASSGIGKGIAVELAAQGANVVFCARRTALIEELAEELGPKAVAVTADVSREQDVERLFDTALERFGSIDVWINNTGIGAYGDFTDTPLKDLIRMIDVNLLGTMFGSHFAISQFKKQGHGTLINIGSFGGSVAIPSAAVYSASKFGVTGLTRGLRQEMELENREDIHVCLVNPWVTDTPWTVHAGNYSGHEILVGPADGPEKVVEAVIGLIDEPKEVVDIGAKTTLAAVAGKLAPSVTDRSTGRFMAQMLSEAPLSPPTEGSLHEPRAEGTGISGDLRERLKMKAEGDK